MCVCVSVNVYALVPSNKRSIYSHQDEVIPASNVPDTSPTTDTAAVGELIEDEIADNLELALADSTGNSNAVLLIRGSAKAWRRRVNWVQDDLPLGLEIVHETDDKHRTRLVKRLCHLQKQIAKKCKGARGKDPRFLGQMFFVTILDGELHNQSVGYQ